MNLAMAPDIAHGLRSVPRQRLRHVTATIVRQIAALGGDVSAFVPAEASSALARAIARRV